MCSHTVDRVGGSGGMLSGIFFDKSRVIWCNLGGGGQKYVITNLKINNFKEKNQQEIFIAIFLSQIKLDEHSSTKKNTFRIYKGGQRG